MAQKGGLIMELILEALALLVLGWMVIGIASWIISSIQTKLREIGKSIEIFLRELLAPWS